MVQCPGEIAGERCTLEDGHYPATPHHVSVQITPDIGRLMAAMIDDLEKAKAWHQKEAKRSRWSYRLALGIIVVYLGLTIYELVTL